MQFTLRFSNSFREEYKYFKSQGSKNGPLTRKTNNFGNLDGRVTGFGIRNYKVFADEKTVYLWFCQTSLMEPFARKTPSEMLN